MFQNSYSVTLKARLLIPVWFLPPIHGRGAQLYMLSTLLTLIPDLTQLILESWMIQPIKADQLNRYLLTVKRNNYISSATVASPSTPIPSARSESVPQLPS